MHRNHRRESNAHSPCSCVRFPHRRLSTGESVRDLVNCHTRQGDQPFWRGGRCGAQRATSAFLVIARPNEPVGRPYLSIIIYGVERGKVNAVDFLHARLSEWERSGGPKNDRSRMDFRPAISAR
jgi:hypothetical protein